MGLHFSERDRARYSGRDNAYGRDRGYADDRDRGREGRDFFDRASDEVRSWFGSDAAEHRRDRDERERYRGRFDENLDHIPARQLMTREVATVHPDDPVARAAHLMRECDCGALPVVNERGQLIGMITDRDIVMRLVARGREIRSARVGDAMTEHAHACHASDDVEDCIESMAHHKVRRMPIVDDRKRVIGILSQGDLAQFAGHRRTGEVGRQVVDVLSEISEPSGRPHR